jgi:transcriptional regulator with XRE-family HTH domain
MSTPDNEKQFRAEFGQRLRDAIERSHFTYHKDFREKADLSDSTLKNWLNGAFMPGVYDLKRISHLLGVDALWLGFGVGNITGSNESFRQLLTRNHDVVTRVLAEVREFASEKRLSNETAATMLIDYLDNELHTFTEQQVKVS